MNTTTTTYVKPADLQSGDRLIEATRYQAWVGPVQVVRVDKVDPGFVRVITHRKGRVDGKIVVGDFQDMFHPNHDISIER